MNYHSQGAVGFGSWESQRHWEMKFATAGGVGWGRAAAED